MKREKIGTLRACCVSVIMFIIGASLYAQSTQRGLVLEYRGSETKTPLKNVSVSAANASATMSDDKGEFTLNFRTLHAGDAIQFRRVELNGYEVMNTEALETARVARTSYENQNQNENPSLNVKHSTLNIVMARRETLQKLRDGYRSIAVQRYEKQLKASEAEIERLKQEGKLAEEQYNERLNALEEEYEEKLSQLENYIDKFARIDLSDLDADEQQIIDFVQAGNFDEALALYDKQNLADRLRQSREDQQKLVAMRDQLAEAANKKAAENQRLRASIDRQVTLLYMAGGEENMLKAHRILKETFLADTTNVEARREYAFSLQRYQQFDEQMALLKSGISTEKDAFNKGMMILDLMAVYWIRGQYDQAYEYANQAESLLSPLATYNYQVLTRALPAWTDVQIAYCQQNNNYESCKSIVSSIRQQWSPDSTNVPSLCSYIALLESMSDYYSRIENQEESLWCVQNSLSLGNILHQKVPSKSDLYRVNADVCSIYLLQGMRKEAKNVARQSASLLKERIEKRSAKSTYQEALEVYYVLLESLVPAGKYALADSIIQDVHNLQVFEKLGSNNDGVYRLYGDMVHFYEALVLLEKGVTEEAKTLAYSSFDSMKGYEDGSDMEPSLKLEFDARYNLKIGQYKEALAKNNELISICKESYDESQSAWDADELCTFYLQQSEIYLRMSDKKNAKKSVKQAEKYAKFKSNQIAIDEMKNKIIAK